MDLRKTTIALAIIAACIFSFLGGFLVSELNMENYRQFSRHRALGFTTGELTFCKITEMERFVVCPMHRYSQNLPTGGTATTYICSKDLAYAEMSDLTATSRLAVEERIRHYRITRTIEEHCKTKNSVVYKIEQKTSKTEGI
jgi:hypothetical protein